MTEPRLGRLRMPLSFAEERVLRALETLPPEYQITMGTRFQFPSWQPEGFPISYEPDFEITDFEGRRIVVEAKSAASLSLANLSRFVKISEMIRATGRGFLLLVWGENHPGFRTSALPEFMTLNIRDVQTDSDVMQAVRSEFALTFRLGDR